MSKSRVLVGTLLVLAAVVGFVPPASGIEGLVIHCHTAGTIGYVNGTPLDAWTVSGQGSCEGDMGGTYFVQFAGTGTSKTLGLCDTNLVVNGLNILVSSTLVNAATGQTKTYTHRWKAPATTYPVATAFIVEHVPAKIPVGAGAFFNHIFANCTGSPVAVFDWAWWT